MCTVSWAHEDGGYQLLCNRDEKRTRAAGMPPREQLRFGVRYLAPADGDFGGTWIAVNEYGLAACLLNGAPGRRGETSRGLVIPEIIWMRSADDAAFLLEYSDLALFSPFTLLLLEPDRQALVAAWNGERLVVSATDGRMPLISSSHDPEGVCHHRQEEFGRYRGDLPGFHASHGTGPSAYSPCMHREDAETVSFTWTKVSRAGISIGYLGAAPCAGGELTWANLS